MHSISRLATMKDYNRLFNTLLDNLLVVGYSSTSLPTEREVILGEKLSGKNGSLIEYFSLCKYSNLNRTSYVQKPFQK